MKTRILITIGDINGIGPEIILKALNSRSFVNRFDITVLSPLSVLEYYYRLLRMRFKFGGFSIISIGDEKARIKPGEITKESGFISGLAVETAVQYCMSGRYDAVVTAPISKKALNLGGYKYDGHTEMLTGLSGAKETAMIMVHKNIRVGFASTHPPLKKAAGLLTRKLLSGKIKACVDSMKKDLGVKAPAVGVLSLNPHAGDGGLIGDEEIKVIRPALQSLRKKMKDTRIDGPYPSDSYFGNGTFSRYDLTFAMYHDQGFIPFKMIAGDRGVNFTAGLDFVRTSPDHGTAFDIAGRNAASELSLKEAIILADRIHRNRISFKKGRKKA